MVCAHNTSCSNLPRLIITDLFPNENFSGEKDSGKVLIIIIILFLIIACIPRVAGATQQSFIQGGSAPRSKPLPYYIPF